MLLFFETRSCLAYTEADLPQSLAELDLSWHVHLPLDLPWEDGPRRVADILCTLARKICHLSPRLFVLHPPPSPTWLDEFAGLLPGTGIPPASILLENTRESDLLELAPVIERRGLSVCLDVGHILAYSQWGLVQADRLKDRCRMLHLYAPGPKEAPGRHQPLDLLDLRNRQGQAGLGLAQSLLDNLRPGDVAVLEVFDPDHLARSLAVLGGSLEVT